MKFYINQAILPNFKRIFVIQKPIDTTSENEYKLFENYSKYRLDFVSGADYELIIRFFF